MPLAFGEGAERFDESSLLLCQTLFHILRDDGPRMTAERPCKPAEPLHSEVPFAQLEVAYLLTRRPNLRRQSDEREPLSLAKLFQAIRQIGSLRRLSPWRRSNSLRDLAVDASTVAEISP